MLSVLIADKSSKYYNCMTATNDTFNHIIISIQTTQSIYTDLHNELFVCWVYVKSLTDKACFCRY